MTGAALADAYADRGILHLATEKPDAAIADFDLAIQAAPDFAEAHVWHGVAMSAKNDKTRARQDFDRALAIDPEFWFAHGMSGLARQEAGEDDAALAELARAIELGMPHRGEYFVRETRYRRHTELTRRGVAYTTKVPVELAFASQRPTDALSPRPGADLSEARCEGVGNYSKASKLSSLRRPRPPVPICA